MQFKRDEHSFEYLTDSELAQSIAELDALYKNTSEEGGLPSFH